MGRTLTPAMCGFSLTLHQLDPEVGNEKEQQQSHGQEDAREQEPAWELSQELRQYGAQCHITQTTDPPQPRAGGVRPQMRAASLSPHLFSSGALAFAQHISVELFVDFALFKQPHEF